MIRRINHVVDKVVRTVLILKGSRLAPRAALAFARIASLYSRVSTRLAFAGNILRRFHGGPPLSCASPLLYMPGASHSSLTVKYCAFLSNFDLSIFTVICIHQSTTFFSGNDFAFSEVHSFIVY
ncbi:hypothetical protein Mapa_014993 [Marchantia paleacea]|nr:hypothetical protein Mapa_014993 [Marchantia paleacea]